MESHPIQRTANASPAHAVEDMRIDHCRFDIAMPQQLLDGSNVRAAFGRCGQTNAERMARVRLRGQPELFSAKDHASII